MSTTGSTSVIIQKKKQKFYIIDDQENVEYIITKKDRGYDNIKYVMKRSKSDIWTSSAKGEKIFTLIDNDLDITIEAHNESMETMHYGNLMALRLLLELVNSQYEHPDESKIILT